MTPPTTREEIIEQSSAILEQAIPNLTTAYLFGSWATGDSNKQSDIDIAFMSSTTIDNIKRWEIQEELARLLSTNVDLIDLGLASEVMQFQVVNNGKRFFSSDEVSAEKYEDKVFALYLDLCELRQPIISHIKESGSFYG